MKLFDLSGRIAVVTGGYGYLGKAVSMGLAQAGATVYVFGRFRKSFLKAFPQGQKDVASLIRFEQADVASTLSVRNAFRRVRRRHTHLDILVNNAFFTSRGNPLSLDDRKWSRGIEGVMNSVYRCLREGSHHFIAQRSGKIINIGSMYGIVSPDFSLYKRNPRFLSPPHYGAAKAGVLQLTRYFANYLGEYNIQVNAVSPGPFPNAAVRKNRGFIKALEARTSLGRIGAPEDLAGAVVFLASPASDFVTGHDLVVDGGWTSR